MRYLHATHEQNEPHDGVRDPRADESKSQSVLVLIRFRGSAQGARDGEADSHEEAIHKSQDEQTLASLVAIHVFGVDGQYKTSTGAAVCNEREHHRHE